MDISGAQIQGARRRQEDAFAIETLGDGVRLVLVADGLGGLPAGDVASREASAEFVRVFRDRARAQAGLPHDWMRHALNEADGHLHRRQAAEPGLAGMSTTLVAVYAREGKACALSVGDSYLMLLRGDTLYVLNELHRGEGSALTSCVGAQLRQIWVLDSLEIQSGDRFLLATDGITTLAGAAIQEHLATAENSQAAVDALLRGIEAALAPHQDNATAVAMFVP
jgi:protein phosphatase